MNTLKYFIWGYQRHFYVSAQTAAKAVFDIIDKRLQPKVFLIGVLQEQKPDSCQVCVEPEDCGYLPEHFEGVLERANHFNAIDPENDIYHSHPRAQLDHERALKAKALRDAILSTFRTSDEYYGISTFCSLPVLVEGYYVSIILQLSREALLSRYSLVKYTNETHREFPISLTDATIMQFFIECSDALSKSNPGAKSEIHKRKPDEIIRAAGELLMLVPSFAAGIGYGSHYNACNVISSMRYEGGEGAGTMLIARRGHPNIKVVLELTLPIRLNESRAIRKLLEISSDGLSLLSDSEVIFGLGQIIGSYNDRQEDLFCIRFTKYYTWELEHDGHTLMRVAYAQPQMLESSLHKEQFSDCVSRILPTTSQSDMEQLWDIVKSAMEQSHGTIVIISPEAESEAIRLESQCIRVKPTKLTPQLIRMVSSIDGAVLIDQTATCFALGVILDGLATANGNSSRGARYNSAIRYVETKGQNHCVAVVVSADGMVDLVPDLMPRVRRSDLNKPIDKLHEIALMNEVDPKEFYTAMNSLKSYQFYLSQKMCDEINDLRQKIQARIKNEGIQILYYDFVESEEMDDSYFIDE